MSGIFRRSRRHNFDAWAMIARSNQFCTKITFLKNTSRYRRASLRLQIIFCLRHDGAYQELGRALGRNTENTVGLACGRWADFKAC